jgi:hypothetical protein
MVISMRHLGIPIGSCAPRKSTPETSVHPIGRPIINLDAAMDGFAQAHLTIMSAAAL